MSNPYQVTDDFEKAIAEYTGAPHVVCVNSCTNALLLSCAWWERHEKIGTAISMPKYSYIGVPMAIKQAGFKVIFNDDVWVGSYQLQPYPIWDCARYFTSNMYDKGFMCVSFHASKILGIEAGGAVLLDDPEAAKWLKKARHDGRTPGADLKKDKPILGWHCLMNPSIAAQGILKLYSLPPHNNPLPMDDYPDLSTFEVFK